MRTDRPDAGAIIAGTAMSTATATHYLATLAGSTQFWFRRGVAYRLTAGTKVSAQALLYTAFRSCGTIFPARRKSNMSRNIFALSTVSAKPWLRALDPSEIMSHSGANT